MSPRVLVIGVGNPERGDDGVGPGVVALLEGRLPPGVGTCTRSGDVLGLVDDWQGADLAVIIDAAAPAGKPGRITRIDPATGALPLPPPAVSSHGMGLPEALALASALGTAPARVVIYAIEGAGFEIGAGLSPPVAAACGDVAERLLAELEGMQREEADA